VLAGNSQAGRTCLRAPLRCIANSPARHHRNADALQSDGAQHFSIVAAKTSLHRDVDFTALAVEPPLFFSKKKTPTETVVLGEIGRRTRRSMLL